MYTPSHEPITRRREMNNQEARRIFDQAIANETDQDRIARVELLREYFTNPEFRAALLDHVAELNRV